MSRRVFAFAVAFGLLCGVTAADLTLTPNSTDDVAFATLDNGLALEARRAESGPYTCTLRLISESGLRDEVDPLALSLAAEMTKRGWMRAGGSSLEWGALNAVRVESDSPEEAYSAVRRVIEEGAPGRREFVNVQGAVLGDGLPFVALETRWHLEGLAGILLNGTPPENEAGLRPLALDVAEMKFDELLAASACVRQPRHLALECEGPGAAKDQLRRVARALEPLSESARCDAPPTRKRPTHSILYERSRDSGRDTFLLVNAPWRIESWEDAATLQWASENARFEEIRFRRLWVQDSDEWVGIYLHFDEFPTWESFEAECEERLAKLTSAKWWEETIAAQADAPPVVNASEIRKKGFLFSERLLPPLSMDSEVSIAEPARIAELFETAMSASAARQLLALRTRDASMLEGAPASFGQQYREPVLRPEWQALAGPCQRALRALVDEEPDAALRHLSEIEDELEWPSLCHFAKARALVDLRRFAAAEVAVLRALERNPDLVPALELAARLVAGPLARPRDGLALAWRFVDLAPGHPEGLLLVAEILAGSGQFESAERRVREALALEPERDETKLALARVLGAQRERTAEAIEVVGPMLARCVPDPACYTEEQVGVIVDAVLAADESDVAFVALADAQPSALAARLDYWLAIGRGLELAGRPELAEHAIRFPLASLTESDAERLSRRAMRCEREGHFMGEMLLLDRVLELEPDYAGVRDWLGWARCVRHGNCEAEVPHFEKRLAADPSDDFLRARLTQVLVSAGRRREAYARLGEWVKLRPDDAEVAALEASFLESVHGDRASAIAAMERAAALPFENATHRGLLGLLAARLGKIERARALLDEAAKRGGAEQLMRHRVLAELTEAGDPSRAWALVEGFRGFEHSLDNDLVPAMVMRRLGQPRTALRRLEIVEVALRPGRPRAVDFYLERARSHQALGESKEALRALLKLVPLVDAKPAHFRLQSTVARALFTTLPDPPPSILAAAHRCAERAVTLSERQNPRLLRLLAEIRAAQGEPEEAKALLEEAGEIPWADGEEIEALRQRLDL